MMKASIRQGLLAFKISALIFVIAFLSGCGDEFWDPTQVGRFRPVPAVNVILDSLGVAEEQSSEWSGAGEPKPVDVMIFETDYTFSPGDTIRISIFELITEGITYSGEFVVTETGKISIPEIGVVEVAGLTESQLEEEIRRILSPSILKEPLVTVLSLSSERRTFSILGNAVPNPGRYSIPRYDFRLNDALAVAGVSAQFNTSYIYVTRGITQKELSYESGNRNMSQRNMSSNKETLEAAAPRASLNRPSSELVIVTAEMNVDAELTDIARPQGFESSTSESDELDRTNAAEESLSDTAQEGTVEWIFKDGKWIPVQTGLKEPKSSVRDYASTEVSPQPLRQQLPETFDWEQLGPGAIQTRVIKIPSDKLAGGDPRYNVVIRPGDTVHVPLDIIGEFAIMGNVNAQGYINLTGRPMTLKMAIAAAGGLGPLAWPKRCEVTRRIGKNREETVMVDLEKIAKGLEPDFFIKPNDLINVGTHPTARWRAVLRNSFRATYGFAFVYDRNFADRDFGTSRPFPSWSW